MPAVVDASSPVRLTRGPLQLQGLGMSTWRGLSRRSHRRMARLPTAHRSRRCSSSASTPDAVDVGFWRVVLGYAPLADDAGVDPLGHGSTVWMQNSTRPSRCGTRCISTSNRTSMSRDGWRRRRRRPRRLQERGTGRSPIGPGTASASPPGPMGPPRRLPTPPEPPRLPTTATPRAEHAAESIEGRPGRGRGVSSSRDGPLRTSDTERHARERDDLR